MLKKLTLVFSFVILVFCFYPLETLCMKKSTRRVLCDTSEKFRAADRYDLTIAPYKGSPTEFSVKDRHTNRNNKMNGSNGYQITACIIDQGYAFCVENRNTVLIWDLEKEKKICGLRWPLYFYYVFGIYPEQRISCSFEINTIILSPNYKNLLGVERGTQKQKPICRLPHNIYKKFQKSSIIHRYSN